MVKKSVKSKEKQTKPQERTRAHQLDEVRRLYNIATVDKCWGLFPAPIDGLSEPEFRRVIEDARYDLFYDEWEDANNGARDLSDFGGIKSVTVFRVKCKVHVSAMFVEGKQVKASE